MNTLLITGVTGFLGGAVLENILKQNNGINLLLLVRADNDDAALARVKENMRKFNVSEEKLATLGTQHILAGDLANPAEFLCDPRLEQVTHVLNCAAVASFGNNPLIWKVNVEGHPAVCPTYVPGCRATALRMWVRLCHVLPSPILWSRKAPSFANVPNTLSNTPTLNPRSSS